MPVYASERYFRWQVGYYMRKLAPDRLRLVEVRSLAEVPGDSFWVIYRTTSRGGHTPPHEELGRLGFRWGEESRRDGSGIEVHVLPVMR